MLLSASTLPSKTIVVTTTNDTPINDSDIGGPTVSLRQAINYANADAGTRDAIEFSSSLTASGPATITLNGAELSIVNSVTITGPGASQLAIDGNNASQIFSINTNDSSPVTITGLTLRNGNGNDGGAIYSFLTTLTLANNVITGNTAANTGGGVCSLDGTLMSSNNVYSGNSSPLLNSVGGGGVYNGGRMTSTGDTFSGNSAFLGGAICNSGSLSTVGDTITGNISSTDGGGIVNGLSASVTSTGDTISGNTAAYRGGGVYNFGGVLSLSFDTIEGNSAASGGGVTNDSFYLPLYGGIFYRGTSKLINDTITGNTATANGGGIDNLSGTVVATNDTIVGNTAMGDGGGIWNADTLSFRNSMILGNIQTNGSDIAGSPVVDGGGNLATNGSDIAGTPVIDGGGHLIYVDLSYVLQTVPGNPAKPLVRSNGSPSNTIGLVARSPAIGTAIALGKVTATGDDGNISLTVDDVTYLAVGNYLRIGTEIVLVQSITPGTGTGGTLTVARGQFGTSQATLNGLPIWQAFDQRGYFRSINDIGSVEMLTPTVVVTPYHVGYDGNAHTATGTATGVGGVDLSSGLDLSGTTHTNAAPDTMIGPFTFTGQYLVDVWTFHDPSGVYADARGAVTDRIAKADAVISVTPYSVVFDGNPHTAQGSATGIGNVNLNSGLILTGTTHTNLGIYNGDTWSFHDNAGNYSDASGTVNDMISTLPIIATQPANATVTAGATASFTATANGTPSPTVQWQVSTDNGTTWNNIPGETSTTYSLTTVAVNHGNQYRAAFTNAVGTVTTNPAMLTVNSAPVITTHPSNVAVLAGATVNVTVAAAGFPVPTVQWQDSTDNGVTWSNVAGATSASLSLTAIAAMNGFQARAVFTNVYGTATTNPATLFIISTPVVTTQPSNRTVLAGAPATFTVASSGSPTTTVQWQQSTDGGTTWTDIAGATSTTYSIASTVGQNGYKFHAVLSNAAGTATSNAATLTVYSAPKITTHPSSVAVLDGSMASVTAAATGFPVPTVQWQRSNDNGVTWSDISGETSASLSFTAIAVMNGYQGRAVFTNAIGKATTNPATLFIISTPVVTTQPSNLTVVAGATATFAVASSGSPTTTVQWQQSTDGGTTWTDIAGATSTTYSFTSTADQNGYELRAVLSNAAGTATSNAATLTVNTVPVVTTQPTNQSVVAGATATFTAESTGMPTATVQWQRSTDGGTTWTNISGATSTTYSFASVVGQNGYKFKAVFSNVAGTAASNAATLTVNSVPVMATQPTNQYVLEGATVNVRVAAVGFPVPAVQWQMSADGGATWTDIPGATSTHISFVATAAQNGLEARAVFTNVAGSVTSNVATLFIISTPVVTTQPSNLTLVVGATATFTAASSASPTTTVQWQRSTDGGTTWTDITGATSTTYSFTSDASQNGNMFHAVFSNAAGTAISNAATLRVGTPPVVTTQPISQTVHSGDALPLIVAASGTPIVTLLRWEVSNDGGLTWFWITSSYFFSPIVKVTLWRAVFTNDFGIAVSNTATITVV